jgi:ATP-dependent helicase HrpB
VRDAVAHDGACVIEAPPGAGKTTRIPPLLLEREGEVIVLEPRRMAARMAARRVAEERGEKVGDTVGYAVRFEEARSARTRLSFVTEGILTRRLTGDPELRGVSSVVLDELHERHVHTDVALALVARLRERRPDLAIVAMSATLDAEPVARFLNASVVRSEGRPFPVNVVHEEAHDDRALELRVASAVRRALSEHETGHVLVFLPGAAEIRRAMDACSNAAAKHHAIVLPLHGDLAAADQDRAVLPSKERKVIVSTNVAESSVTIDDVVAVVDSGLVRRAEHSPYTGLPSLRVEKASRASCVQRAGRAGRTRAGHAYRLYSRADFEARPEHETPEILRADLTGTVLELAASGASDVRWLDPPPPKALDSARALLRRLSAVDAGGVITEMGRAMIGLPLHPRLARVVLEAGRRGVSADGVTAAALLGERDVRQSSRLRPGQPRTHDRATDRSDVIAMMDALYTGDDVDRAAVRRVELARKQLERLVRAPQRLAGKEAEDALLVSILTGYSDRVAKRLSGRSFALAGGKAELGETSVVRDAPLVVAVDAEQRGTSTLIRIASEVTPEQLVEVASDRLDESASIEWNEAEGRAERVTRTRFDGLIIDESRAPARGAEASDLLYEHAKGKLVTDDLASLRARSAFAHGIDSSIPAIDDDVVDRALRACCDGLSSLAEVRGEAVSDLVRATADMTTLERIAPLRITLPSGRSARIVYESGKDPWIESRIQDFFGLAETPRIGGGRVPLVLHLLAPNQRAVQVTADLAGFWERHYPSVRKELMRKYPRHAWPERPV